jgi:IS30 family transposase
MATHLTVHERYQIERALAQGLKPTMIARRMGRGRSTIYDEIKRGQFKGRYWSAHAEHRADAGRQRSASNHPTKAAALWNWVEASLAQDHSPAQIVARLQCVAPPRWRISVPAIYKRVARDRRNGGELHLHLRRAHRHDRWRYSSGGLPKNRPSIRERPAHVKHRLRRGHWEGDTCQGGHAAPDRTLVVVERKSLYSVLRKLKHATAQETADRLIDGMRDLPLRSITFDNGSEFADYERVRDRLHCAAFFAQPRQPTQRARCENTIGLLRQYVPKHRSQKKITQQHLDEFAVRLNHRPRVTLGGRTPHEVLFNLTPVRIRS